MPLYRITTKEKVELNTIGVWLCPAVGRITPGSFPKIALDDWKALARGEVIDQLGDILRRRIVLHQKQGFTELFKE